MAPSDPKPKSRSEDGDLSPTPSEVTATPLASPRGGEPPRVAGTAPALAPGAELDGRYRIVRFIAAGGMGEVYEATDEALGAEIALKTIRPEVVARETVMERFHREIVLARRVTHPNVCRIFDLGSHPVPNGAPLAFLTMELLPGETLRQYLRGRGALHPQEALPLAAQMGAGLAAAHDAGVVHRDFKPANVMLVPARAAGSPPRVVITDFGLAWAGDIDTSITRTDHIVGTAAYVAPEQVEGREVTAASDIYAFGVVLYEMVTGRLPFEGDSPLSTVLKRFHDAPVSPRDHAPALDRAWETTILRCLERDPHDRFVSANAVVAALRGETVPALPRSRTARRAPWWRAGLGLAAVALLAATAYLWTHRPAPPAGEAPVSPSSAAPRRAVAVLGFKNLSGRPEQAWLSTALSEMFTAELAAGARLRTVPGENIARMKSDLGLPESDTLGKDTLARIRAHAGADVVLLGSYLALGESGGRRLRIDLRLQDAAAGETVATFTETGSEAEVFDLVSRAGARLRESLGAAGGDAGSLRAALPSTADAARLYAEGLHRLRSYDALAARSLLEQATQADPGFAPAQAALAAAWAALGYDAKAADAARRAYESAREVSPEERLVIEGRFREASREWPKAVEVYRTLVTSFPDDVEHALRLAGAQISAGQAKDARETLAAVRHRPPPASEDPRIDLTEALVSEALGDFKQEEEEARRAAEKASVRGMSLLRARARLAEAWALRHLGKPREATAASKEAREIYTNAGDHGGVALSLLFLSNALEDEGDLVGAKKAAEEGLAIRRRIGDDNGMARMLNTLANVVDAQGDTNGARRRREEALALFKKVGNPYGVAVATFNLANIKAKTGDHVGAQADYQQALAGFRQVGNQMGIASALTGLGNEAKERMDFAAAKRHYAEALGVQQQIGDVGGQAVCRLNLALMATLLGELDDAQKSYDEALRLTRAAENRSLEATTLAGLGYLTMERGDLPAARRHQEQAMTIRTEIGEERSVGESRVLLAEIALEEGRAKEAEALAREAAAVFVKASAADWRMMAAAFRARALLALGQLAEARAELHGVPLPPSGVVPPEARYPFRVAEGLALAASGDGPGATKRLEAAAAEAGKAGLKIYELEARLAQGEIEMLSGRKDAARTRLLAVESEAKAKGLGLLARKAATAAGR